MIKDRELFIVLDECRDGEDILMELAGTMGERPEEEIDNMLRDARTKLDEACSAIWDLRMRLFTDDTGSE